MPRIYLGTATPLFGVLEPISTRSLKEWGQVVATEGQPTITLKVEDGRFFSVQSAYPLLQDDLIREILRPFREEWERRLWHPYGHQFGGYLENSHILPAGEPAQPIHRELYRRMSVLREQRREAALSPGDDEQFATWTKVRDRGAKLSGVTVCFLLGRPYRSIRPSSEPIALPACPYAEGIDAGHEDFNRDFSYRPERNPYHSHPAYGKSWETGYDHGNSDAESAYEHSLDS